MRIAGPSCRSKPPGGTADGIISINETPNRQDDYGSDDCAYQSSALIWPVPADRLTKPCRDKGSDDAENDRHDEAGRIIGPWSKKPSDQPGKKANDDDIKYVHNTPPNPFLLRG
jgi:hypothetical protein